MAHALRSTVGNQPALTIPTKREIEMFLLTPHRKMSQPIEEIDEDDGLTKVRYYSPTAD